MARYPTRPQAQEPLNSWLPDATGFFTLVDWPSNAPVQARWAHAQRAGQLPPNPPSVACNRLLASIVPRTSLVYRVRQLSTVPRDFRRALTMACGVADTEHVILVLGWVRDHENQVGPYLSDDRHASLSKFSASGGVTHQPRVESS